MLSLLLDKRDPKSTLCPLRDDTTTFGARAHKYMWIYARAITRWLPILHHICRFNKTQKVWAYSIRSKDEALKVFTRWITKVEKRFGYRVKKIRSDNEGEYTSKAFKQYLSDKGIWHQKTIPYTPMQNGVAGWINQMIQVRMTAML